MYDVYMVCAMCICTCVFCCPLMCIHVFHQTVHMYIAVASALSVCLLCICLFYYHVMLCIRLMLYINFRNISFRYTSQKMHPLYSNSVRLPTSNVFTVLKTHKAHTTLHCVVPNKCVTNCQIIL